MKKTVIISIILLFSFAQYIAAQDCKVLLPNLQGNYEGECKKGLADGHGKAVGAETYEGNFKKGLPNGYGKYIFKDGSTFEGDFKKGLKNGDGRLTFTINQRDSVVEGVWKKDVFKGKKELPPFSVTRNANVMRFRFREIDATRNRIDIRILRDGQHLDVERLTITPSSGRENNVLNNTTTIEEYQLPLKISISYVAASRTKNTHSLGGDKSTSFDKVTDNTNGGANGATVDCRFDIIITKAGYFQLELQN